MHEGSAGRKRTLWPASNGQSEFLIGGFFVCISGDAACIPLQNFTLRPPYLIRCGLLQCEAIPLRRELPGAEGGLGDRFAPGRDLDVVAPWPSAPQTSGRRATTGCRTGRWCGCRASARGRRSRRWRGSWSACAVGERRLLAELHLAAVERVGAAGARHLDVEEGGRCRHSAERTVLAKGDSAQAPSATARGPCRSASRGRPTRDSRAPASIVAAASRAPAWCGRRTSRGPWRGPPAGGSGPWRACRR